MLWLSLGHTLAGAEQLYEFSTRQMDEMCEVVPDLLCGFACVNNPQAIICEVSNMYWNGVAYGILVVATIAFQVADHIFEKETLGPDAAIYGYEYSQATYINAQNYHAWSVKALKAMDGNTLEQHTEMKQQLQERHRDIANHVGEDIADAQNALGSAIVDAQNQLGQGIVNAQNALGHYVVDAQNANGKAIIDASNYITSQHNNLSMWLH